MEFADHFSTIAADYARFRPKYPGALFRSIVDRVSRRDTAWDCATGNGQAAVDLASHFERIVASDGSAEQLANAVPADRVRYVAMRAEQPGLADRSVDLVTVAQAVHWFDLDAFYAAVHRVVRPGGALAVWTYCAFETSPAIDAIITRLYRDVLGSYWPDRFEYVDHLYRTLPFPFEEVEVPECRMEASWDLDALVGFISSWSATQRFREARGKHALESLYGELAAAWGEPSTKRTLRWPLGVRVGRVGP